MTPNSEHMAAAKAEGERRKDVGMKLAANKAKNSILILEHKIKFLEAIRRNPDRTATTDDIGDDPLGKFADGGKWRGSVTRGLAEAGLIEKAGYTESHRAARHRGSVRRWRGRDDAAIASAIADLRDHWAILKEAEKPPRRCQPSFDFEGGRPAATDRPEGGNE